MKAKRILLIILIIALIYISLNTVFYMLKLSTAFFILFNTIAILITICLVVLIRWIIQKFENPEPEVREFKKNNYDYFSQEVKDFIANNESVIIGEYIEQGLLNWGSVGENKTKIFLSHFKDRDTLNKYAVVIEANEPSIRYYKKNPTEEEIVEMLNRISSSRMETRTITRFDSLSGREERVEEPMVVNEQRTEKKEESDL